MISNVTSFCEILLSLQDKVGGGHKPAGLYSGVKEFVLSSKLRTFEYAKNDMSLPYTSRPEKSMKIEGVNGFVLKKLTYRE